MRKGGVKVAMATTFMQGLDRPGDGLHLLWGTTVEVGTGQISLFTAWSLVWVAKCG